MPLRSRSGDDGDGDGDDSSGVILAIITSHGESASLNCFHMLIHSKRLIGRTQSFISSALMLRGRGRKA